MSVHRVDAASSCDGKQRFVKAHLARRAARRGRRSRVVYRCRFCGGFHVADATKRVDRRAELLEEAV